MLRICPAMTDELMNLRSLVEKSVDVDLLREMIVFAAEKLRGLEVGVKNGCGPWRDKCVPARLAELSGTPPDCGEGSGDGHVGHFKNQVSRLCEEINDRVKTILTCPIEGDSPHLWIDAAYLKVVVSIVSSLLHGAMIGSARDGLISWASRWIC